MASYTTKFPAVILTACYADYAAFVFVASILGWGMSLAGAQERVASGQSNLFVNGDFEDESPRSPPLGWAMWGAQQYKNPQNYQRDTTVARSGRASLRIVHPKDTAGYIVTDPQMAIRPAPGMMYQISFFARADRPCRGRFMILGYQSIRPFVDAESPLSKELPLDGEWREFRFEIRESIDFFAESSRYLLLGFSASTDPKVECTAWIDDVVVTAKRMDLAARLINPASLKVSPLGHRLRPGPRLEVTADVSSSQTPALATACGVSFHRLVGYTGFPFGPSGEYNLPKPLEDAIRELNLPLTRFYGVGHEPPRDDLPPWPVEVALDRLAQFCGRIGVAKQNVVIELEEQSANRKLEPAIWAQAARYSNLRGYGFRYWEVSNEPYSQTFGSPQPKGDAFRTPDDYVSHVKNVAEAIRRVDPHAHIGVAIAVSRPPWGNYVLKNAAGSYDFVVAHYYGFEQAYKSSFEDLVLRQNYRILNQIAQYQALIEAYNPGRTVYQLDTEWGMHSGGPNGERADYANRNGNIIGVVHRAVRMIYYVREQPLAGASSWQMLGNSRGLGFPLLVADRPEARTMLYWLYYYFIRHVGAYLLDFHGAAPFYPREGTTEPHSGPVTPVLLTTDRERRTVFCIIANGSWTESIPCQMQFKNFQGKLASAVFLSDDDLDGNPLLTSKDRFVRPLSVAASQDRAAKNTLLRATIPPHSVVFVSLARSP